MAEPIKLPSLVKSIAAPQGSNPQDVQVAKDQLTMAYAPQEMGINSAIDFINQNLSRDINAQQQYGEIADQKIGQIGNDLANTLQGNVTKVQDIYEKGTAEVGSSYDEAMNTLKGVGSSIQGHLKSSAGTLGQEQALKADPYGTDPLSRLMADQATYQSKTAAGKATATANMATLGTQLTAIAQKAVGDSAKDYAQKRADVATNVLKVIGELQTTAQFGMMEQLQKFSVLAETIGPAFRTLINQAAGARTEAARLHAKDQLDAYLKMADLDIKQGGLALRQQEAMAKNDPNSLDNQLKQVNLAKGIRDLDSPGPTTYISDAAGAQRLQQLLNQSRRKDRNDPNGLSGTQIAGIEEFISQNLGSSKMSGLFNTADAGTILASIASQWDPKTKTGRDPKTGLVHLPFREGTKYKNRDKGDYVVDMQTLLAALEARFGNVGPSSKIGTKI